MNHRHHETAERQANPKEPCEKVRKEKLSFIEDNAESSQSQGEQAKHQSDELKSVESRLQREVHKCPISNSLFRCSSRREEAPYCVTSTTFDKDGASSRRLLQNAFIF